MKTRILLILLLLISLDSFASLRMTKYRWRNDDGNEATATWKAAQNTPITVSNTNELLRLRIEMDNDNANSYDDYPDGELEYSKDGGVNWTLISNSATNDFRFITSPNVTHNANTTTQITGTFGTYQAGKIIADLPNAASEISLYDGGRTEYEWVLSPTAFTQPMTTYNFRIAYYYDLIATPTLTTTCINSDLVSVDEGFTCVPGTVTLTATTNPGGFVRWYDAQNNLVGNGPTFVTPVLNADETYQARPYVVYGNNQECFGTPVSVTARYYPIPNVNLGRDTAFCEGNAYTLIARGSFASYLWDDNLTTPARTVSQTGRYHVTVTATGGCKASDTINVTVNPLPIVDLGPDREFCYGDTIVLDANPSNLSVQVLWENNTTNPIRSVTEPGNYGVEVKNSFGCIARDNIILTTKDEPLADGINIIFAQKLTYNYNIQNPRFVNEVEWDFGDGSPTAKGNYVTHTYAKEGLYNVTAKMSSVCPGNPPAIIVNSLNAIGGTGINTLNPEDVSIYPIPTKDQLFLKLTDDNTFIVVSVHNNIGQQLLSFVPGNASSFTLDLAHLSSGIYMLRLETSKGLFYKKIQVVK